MYQITILFILLLSGCASIQTSKCEQGIRSETITTDDGQRAHVATIDLRHAELALVTPEKKGELLTPAILAKQHDAPVAINAGFFGGDGTSVSALKINGRWHKAPNHNKLRGVVGFDNRHGIIFDRLTKRDDKVVNDESSKFAKALWWNEIDNIVGGAPLLLIDGEKVDFLPEQTLSTFLSGRYARTAICSVDASTVKLIVVDGGDRKTNLIVEAKGMTMDELADFLLTLGCKNALNLDGGYSSSFFSHGKTLSRFSVDTPVRPVQSVIIARPRKGNPPKKLTMFDPVSL